MTIQKFTVQGTPQPSTILKIGLATEATIYNPSSSVTVNISDTTGGVFFPVAPGTTVTWDAGKPLYAQANTTVDIYVLDNGGSINNPSILADLIVDSGLGKSVADALVASSLAANIGAASPVPPSASAIGASVSGGIAVTGAPPINAADLLYAVTTADTAAQFTSTTIDVAKYQSLKIQVALDTGGPLSAPQAFREINLSWGALSSGAMSDSFSVMDSNNVVTATNGFAQVYVPVRAGTLTIVSPAAAASSIMTIRVIGSYATIPEMKYAQLSTYWGGGAYTYYGSGRDRMQSMFTASKPSGTTLDYPAVMGSRAKVYMSSDNVTAAMSWVIEDAQSSNVIHFRQNAATGSGFVGQGELFIPNRPITARIVGAGTNVRFSIVYE